MSPRRPTEERRRQIADAALDLIAEEGLGRFTTQAIAARVGLTDGSLFRHFPTKEAIVHAALDRVEERLFAGLPPDDPDPVVRLERFLRARASIVAAQPVIAKLVYSEELAHAAGPEGAERVRAWRRRSLAFIVACIEEGEARGLVRPGLPARDLGLAVMGTLLVNVHLSPSAADPAVADRAWRVVERILGLPLDPPDQEISR